MLFWFYSTFAHTLRRIQHFVRSFAGCFSEGCHPSKLVQLLHADKLCNILSAISFLFARSALYNDLHEP